MDTTQELRTTNLTTKRNCLSRIARSPIPAPVAKTLTLILEHFGSATHYSLAWISHRKLAELQGRSERSVERHCKAIVESRLLTVEPMGCGQARAMLMTRYGHTMKGVYAHFLCFYSINSEHPFWQGDEAATAEVVATMRTAVSWPSRTASNGAEPRHKCRREPRHKCRKSTFRKDSRCRACLFTKHFKRREHEADSVTGGRRTFT